MERKMQYAMINERGVWLSKEETDTHQFDKLLSDFIINRFIVKTVVDIGCGNGAYTMNFINHGINCMGFDGSPLTRELTNNICHIKDFSIPQYIGKYDMVLSLEVGEHIPGEYEQIFIDNLCHASKKYIIMSWAIEGQEGTGHVNCRNNDYIISQIEKRRFYYNPEGTQQLRKVSTLPWFKNTLMAFIK